MTSCPVWLENDFSFHNCTIAGMSSRSKSFHSRNCDWVMKSGRTLSFGSTFPFTMALTYSRETFEILCRGLNHEQWLPKVKSDYKMTKRWLENDLQYRLQLDTWILKRFLGRALRWRGRGSFSPLWMSTTPIRRWLPQSFFNNTRANCIYCGSRMQVRHDLHVIPLRLSHVELFIMLVNCSLGQHLPMLSGWQTNEETGWPRNYLSNAYKEVLFCNYIVLLCNGKMHYMWVDWLHCNTFIKVRICIDHGGWMPLYYHYKTIAEWLGLRRIEAT